MRLAQFFWRVRTSVNRKSKLFRAFAIVGFCNGVLISGMILYSEWRELHPTRLGWLVIGLILFPAGTQLWEFEGGKASEVANLFLYSIVNGCLYGIAALLVASALEAWRRHSQQSRI